MAGTTRTFVGSQSNGSHSLNGVDLDAAIAKSLLESCVDLQIFVVDRQLKYVIFNPGHANRIREIWGTEISVGMTMPNIIENVQLRGYFTERLLESLNGKEVSFCASVSVMAGQICSRFHLAPIRDAGGVVVGVVAVVSKRSADLCQVHDRLAITLNSISDAVLAANVDGQIFGMNPACERMTGLSEANVRNRKANEVLHIFDAYDRQKAVDLFEMAIKNVLVSETPVCYLMKSEDGTERLVQASGGPTVDRNGNTIGAVLVLRDVTQAKLAEERLMQSQKMEAIGRLAGGIAHDFNNQLTVISGYCDLLAQAMSLDDHRRGILNEIMHAAEKSSTLTSQLLAFGRKQFLRPQVLDVNAALDEMRDPLAHLIGEDVHFVVTTQAKPSVIFADRGMFEQAVINLAINARDAMPVGGTFNISTSNTHLRAGEAHDVREGEYVVISIADSGAGMDKESLTHVFDPFFTTKPVGRGTGMGMSMVYGFVKQSGGHISVHSSLEKGTTVMIYLPPYVAPSGEEGVSISSQSPGAANIIVVEDNEAVRRLVVRILKDMKYNVLCASDGAEALPVIEHFYGKVDMLVTDIVMPNMSGYELAKRVRKFQPDCKVVFITGYSEVPGIDQEELAAIGKLLSKPFTRETLTGIVEESLGKK